MLFDPVWVYNQKSTFGMRVFITLRATAQLGPDIRIFQYYTYDARACVRVYVG